MNGRTAKPCAAITIGPLENPAVTHFLPSQIGAFLDAGHTALKRWRAAHQFPEPVVVLGQFYYARADVEAWTKSPNAPRWLRGRAAKPSGCARQRGEAVGAAV